MDKAAFFAVVNEAIRKIDNQTAFDISPPNGVAERTRGWTTTRLRLVRDYEQGIEVPAPMIHVALESPLLQEIAH